MNFKDYQGKSMRTVQTGQSRETRLTMAALGLVGEAGEVVDRIKKILYHDHDVDTERPKLVEELGDVLWYMAVIAEAIEVGLDVVANTNVDKLFRRYPEGFRGEDSVNREPTTDPDQIHKDFQRYIGGPGPTDPHGVERKLKIADKGRAEPFTYIDTGDDDNVASMQASKRGFVVDDFDEPDGFDRTAAHSEDAVERNLDFTLESRVVMGDVRDPDTPDHIKRGFVQSFVDLIHDANDHEDLDLLVDVTSVWVEERERRAVVAAEEPIEVQWDEDFDEDLDPSVYDEVSEAIDDCSLDELNILAVLIESERQHRIDAEREDKTFPKDGTPQPRGTALADIDGGDLYS